MPLPCLYDQMIITHHSITLQRRPTFLRLSFTKSSVHLYCSDWNVHRTLYLLFITHVITNNLVGYQTLAFVEDMSLVLYMYRTGNKTQKVISDCAVSCESLFKLISSD